MDLPYLTPLTQAQLRGAGVPEGWSYGIRDRVRFPDLDALNHVNNARYLTWFEQLRVGYMMDYGVTRYDEDSPRLVIRSASLDFEKEMVLGEDYIVTARTRWYRTSSFLTEYACFSPDLRVTGTALVVLRSRDGAGKWPLSEVHKATFRDRDDAEAKT